MDTTVFHLVMACVGLAVLSAGLAVAAVGDVRTNIIPNRLNLALAGGFVAMAPLMGMGLGATAIHVGVGLAVFAGCMAAFAIGVFGGGDAKLAAAASVWLGPAALTPFLLYTVLAGGVLAVALLIGRAAARRFGLPRGPRWARRILRRQSAIPYGVALAAGALAAAPAAAWFPAGPL